MAKFVDNYPEYRKMQGNVSKHVTLVTEMSKIVEERKLMLVSQTEQELACNGGQGAAFEVLTHFAFDIKSMYSIFKDASYCCRYAILQQYATFFTFSQSVFIFNCYFITKS